MTELELRTQPRQDLSDRSKDRHYPSHPLRQRRHLDMSAGIGVSGLNRMGAPRSSVMAEAAGGEDYPPIQAGLHGPAEEIRTDLPEKARTRALTNVHFMKYRRRRQWGEPRSLSYIERTSASALRWSKADRLLSAHLGRLARSGRFLHNGHDSSKVFFVAELSAGFINDAPILFRAIHELSES
jgi:hypothetical protein